VHGDHRDVRRRDRRHDRVSAVLVRALAVVALAACGRIGFDELGAGNLDADPGLPASGLVVSRTALAGAGSFSWVAVDVDWARSLAYVGTREAGRCVAMIDFANEAAPAIVRWIGAPDTTCLEVALVDPDRLVVMSTGASSLKVWSLGPDPRAAAPTLLGQRAIASPRHFTVDTAGATPRLLVAAEPAPGIVEVELQPTGLALIDSWPGTCALPYQAVVAIANQVVVGCQADNSPIEILARNGLDLIASLPNSGPGVTGSWTATALADGRAVVLGWANVVVRNGSVVTRWQTVEPYRHVIASDADTVWTAVGDGSIEVLSLATDGVARVIGRSELGTGRETYGVRLDPSRRRGIAVTNRGYFVVFDPTRIAPADLVYP
jgi:hypothetical protein